MNVVLPQEALSSSHILKAITVITTSFHNKLEIYWACTKLSLNFIKPYPLRYDMHLGGGTPLYILHVHLR